MSINGNTFGQRQTFDDGNSHMLNISDEKFAKNDQKRSKNACGWLENTQQYRQLDQVTYTATETFFICVIQFSNFLSRYFQDFSFFKVKFNVRCEKIKHFKWMVTRCRMDLSFSTSNSFQSDCFYFFLFFWCWNVLWWRGMRKIVFWWAFGSGKEC